MIKTKIIYCCIKCGDKICHDTAFYGMGQCKHCSQIQKVKDGAFNNYYKNLKGKNNPQYKFGKPKCKRCDKRLTNYGTNYCLSCFPQTRKGKPARISYSGKQAPAYKDGRTLKPTYCIDCNKKINWKAKWCYPCSCKHKIGKQNPNYKHGQGYAPYPIYFNNKLRLKIRIRDGFKCQYCCIKEKDHIKIKKVVLDIHHINYDKQNCNKTNLITLCHQCNVKANGNIDYWYAYFTYKLEAIK